ncbi:MAG: thiamine pyrophosphate-dependent enzyme [Salinibacter sp.]
MVYDSYSVGQYLVDRLHELGARHLFSVPGPYCAEWLHHYVEQSASVRRIGLTNALNAGYAADGYARTSGVGAVCVPHSVGTYSLLNAVAGSFVERVPVIVLTGAPPAEGPDLRRGRSRPLAGAEDANRRVYADVTCAAERIAEPERAPQQIDRVLRACLRARRPVFLEATADVYDRPCPPPDGPLSVRLDRPSADPDGLLTHIADRLRAAESAVVWGGAELQRYGLEREFEALVQALDVPYVTSLPGKGLLPENHDHFAGVLDPSGTPSAVRALVADAEYVLGLGVGPSCASAPDVVLDRDGATLVHRDGVRAVPPAGPQSPAEALAPDAPIDLHNLLFRLWTNVAGGLSLFGGAAAAAQTRTTDDDDARPSLSASADTDITYQGFFDLVAEYVEDTTLVMSGVGLDRFGGAALPVRGPSGFICQAAYGDAGYVAPAAIGADLGTDAERVLVLVGDGGFQMTASCVGTMAEKGLDPILFVLNNGVYGSEQRRTDAAAFEHGEAFFPQALLQHWHYRKLPDAMGGKGWRVETYGQLRSAVEEARKYTGGPLLIDVRLRQRSLPALVPEALEAPERPVDLADEAVLSTSS